MKPRDIAKEIFGLTVRLLGLYFLWVALKDLDAFTYTDATILKDADSTTLIAAVPPVLFNLAVAWWLLGSHWLIRRAFPEGPGNAGRATTAAERVKPDSPPAGVPDPATAETKLAALVGKPKDGSAR